MLKNYLKKGKNEADENKSRQTFFLSKEVRWSTLACIAENIGEKIEHVLRIIERDDPGLRWYLIYTKHNDKIKYPDDKLRKIVSK